MISGTRYIYLQNKFGKIQETIKNAMQDTNDETSDMFKHIVNENRYITEKHIQKTTTERKMKDIFPDAYLAKVSIKNYANDVELAQNTST